IVAVVGDDFDAADVFHERGIDISELKRVKGGKTFFWSGEYGYDLNTAHTLETQLNVITEFDPKLSEAALDAKVVFLGNIDPRIQRSVRDQSPSGLVAMDTMNYWIEGHRE